MVETETKYRIVIDTVIPQRPPVGHPSYPNWLEKYDAIWLLSNYSGRDYDSIKGMRQVVNSCAKGGRYNNFNPANPKYFVYHFEEAEVVWNWKEIDDK